MVAKLTITIDHLPHRVSDRDRKSIINQIAAELSSFSGIWRINTLKINYRSKLQGISFAAKSIVGVKGQRTHGIRFAIRIGNGRGQSFDGTLVPPKNQDINKVYQKLNLVESNEFKLPIGEEFLGKISSIRSDGIIVRFGLNGSVGSAFCPTIELGHKYVKDLKEKFVADRYMLVRIISTDDAFGLIASRKIMLPHKDEFDSTPMKNNKLWMKKFTASEERMQIALTVICASIEKHAIKAAWDRIGGLGGVFVIDKFHACAPAELVRMDLRRGLCKQYSTPARKPIGVSHLGEVFKKLCSNGHIRIARISTGKSPYDTIGYCITKAGYQRLKKEPPSLPEYYDPILTVIDGVPDDTPTDDTPPDNTPPDNTPPDNTPTDNTPPDNNTTGIPEQDNTMSNVTINNDMIKSLGTLIKEYKEKMHRLAEVEKLLEDFELLSMERDELQQWLNDYPHIPELIATLSKE